MLSSIRLSIIDKIVLFFVLLLFLSRQEPLLWMIRGQRLLMGITSLIAIYYLTNPRILNIFLKEGKWIIFSIFYLVAILFLKHGSTSDITRLLFTYLISTSFFVIGMQWGLYNKVKLFNTFLFLLFVISILNLLPFIFSTLITQNIDKRALSIFYNLEANSLIMFWPYIFIIGFVGFFNSYYSYENKLKKRFLVALFLCFIALTVMSAYAAIVMMLTMSILLYYYFNAIDLKSQKNIIYLFLTPVILMLSLNLIASGLFGDLGGTSEKINAFIGIFKAESLSERESLLNTASATRYQRFATSFEGFFESPLVGVGYVFESSKFGVTEVASGHSSIFDFLSYFGLFSIVFYAIFINFIRKTRRLSKNYQDKLMKKKNNAILSLIVTYFAISSFNPYLQFSTIDLIFLLSGWSIGQLFFYSKSNHPSYR